MFSGSDRLQAAVPWLVLGLMLLWCWHRIDLFKTVPAYGDVLEGIWAVWWYDHALRLGLDPAIYHLAFHPAGWYVSTYAWGPANLLLMFPLYLLGGGAFAYNLATLLSFVIAFAGTYRLGLRFTSRLGATLAALLYTFWGFRWYSIAGQLNVGLGSALLPWLIYFVERGYHSVQRQRAWYILAGLTWALSVSCSLYYIWIHAAAYFAWLIGRLSRRSVTSRLALWPSLLVPLAAGVLSLPAILWFWFGSRGAGTPFFSVYDVNLLGTSLNAIPLFSLQHPWLGTLSQGLYHGSWDHEVAGTGLGPLTCFVAMAGLVAALRRENWRPILALGLFGLVMSLGLTLRWDDQTVQWSALRPINGMLWDVLHRLRPAFFVGDHPPAPFTDAIYLPGMLLTGLLPGLERARVFARYAFLLGLAVFLLAGAAAARVRRPSTRAVLVVLLIIEVLPAPSLALPYPPPPHPAFAWLRQQSVAPQGIIELATTSGYRLELPAGGSTIYATIYHNQPTVSGAGSVLPAQVGELQKWLVSHAHPFQDPEFMVLLSYYRLRYVLLDMNGGWENEALREANQNQNLTPVQCFQPGAGALWVRPICVFEFRLESRPKFNLLLREGWSGAEDWGRWIDGTSAKALWIITAPAGQRLTIEVFPQCVENRRQRLWLEVNGTTIGDHQWENCEPWHAQIELPSNVLRLGANELVLRAAYAAQPKDGNDPRALSVGVGQLSVQSIP